MKTTRMRAAVALAATSALLVPATAMAAPAAPTADDEADRVVIPAEQVSIGMFS